MDIYIRPLTETDANISYKWRNNPTIWKYTGRKPDKKITKEIEQKWIKEVLARNNEKRFAICLKENDKYIGNVQLTHINKNQKTARFHIFIGDINYWGKGIATKATQLMVSYGFDKLKLNSIDLIVNSKNIAAVKAYKKTGFYITKKLDNDNILMQINNIVVSISCMTYNHVKYIKKTIDSFLMQKTNFNFEILIHDDASTDGTTEIIKEYEKQYPNIIKPLYEKENQWKKGNKGGVTFNFPRAKGKYIAICDGDDYWIDPYKLQKQVNILENNETIGLVSTHVTNLYEKTNKTKKVTYFKEKIKLYNFNDLVCGKAKITTSATIFRKSLLLNYSNSPLKNHIIFYDYINWLLISYHSQIAILKDNTTVYRVLLESTYNTQSITKLWKFRKKAYENVLYLFEKVFNLKPDLKNKMIMCRLTTRYILAYKAKDYDFVKYALNFFKQNNDTIRYNFLKLSLKYPFFFRFLETYEKIKSNDILSLIQIIKNKFNLSSFFEIKNINEKE